MKMWSMNNLSPKVYMEQIMSVMDTCMGVNLLLKVSPLQVQKSMIAVKKRNSWVGPQNFYSHHNINRGYTKRRGNKFKVRIVRADRRRSTVQREEGKVVNVREGGPTLCVKARLLCWGTGREGKRPGPVHNGREQGSPWMGLGPNGHRSMRPGSSWRNPMRPTGWAVEGRIGG
jgi:hypothetical protein